MTSLHTLRFDALNSVVHSPALDLLMSQVVKAEAEGDDSTLKVQPSQTDRQLILTCDRMKLRYSCIRPSLTQVLNLLCEAAVSTVVYL